MDFLALDDKHPIITEVPLEFVGVSNAVREQGGKLNFKNEKVKVRCLPTDLPSKIEVDVSVLSELGQKLIMSDLKVKDAVKILNNPSDPVVDVNIPKKIIIEETVVAAPVVAEAAKEGEAVAEAPADEKGAKGAEPKKEKE